MNATVEIKTDVDGLIIDHLYVVEIISRQFFLRFRKSIELEDIRSAGYLGLVLATKKFDPNRGYEFRTYAEHRIRGEILDWARSCDPISRSARKRVRDLEEGERNLCAVLGREPNSEELSAFLGIDLSRVDHIRQDALLVATKSLDDLDAGGSRYNIEDVVDNNDGSDKIRRSAEFSCIAGLFDRLPKKQREVMTLYYVEGLLMKEIGRTLNLTESRVSQLHAQALGKIRKIVTR